MTEAWEPAGQARHSIDQWGNAVHGTRSANLRANPCLGNAVLRRDVDEGTTRPASPDAQRIVGNSHPGVGIEVPREDSALFNLN